MKIGQTKRGSVFEAIVNVLVGFILSMISNILILGAYGIHITVHQQFQLTLWFTGISIARSYILRRIFNYFTAKRGEKRT